MGNLDTYQAMTSLAKKVGGPKALLAATAVAGYVVIRNAEAGAPADHAGSQAAECPLCDEGRGLPCHLRR